MMNENLKKKMEKNNGYILRMDTATLARLWFTMLKENVARSVEARQNTTGGELGLSKEEEYYKILARQWVPRKDVVADLNRTIEYIKTINNYQNFVGELKQCIWIEHLENIFKELIEKYGGSENAEG